MIHRAIEGQSGNLILVDFTTAREENKLTITLTLGNTTAAQDWNKVVMFLWISNSTRAGQAGDLTSVI